MVTRPIAPDDPGDHGKQGPLTISGSVEITNDVGDPIPVSGAVNVTDVTASVERKLDGDHVTGVDTITIPDGVITFGVTVLAVGAGVTISGPDFVAPVTMFPGQSINHSADRSNTINGPIVITTTAGSEVNATWLKP